MKFVILCYPRTASTLLITALGEHPNVRQGMEIFNPVLEGDAPYVSWRKNAFDELYGPQESYLNVQGYLDGERFDLSRLSRNFFSAFDGTKIMYDQLDRHSPVWDDLRALPDLRVIVMRRNFVAAAVSFRIAMDSGVWHVAAGEHRPETPVMTYDPGYIGWFYDHFCSREQEFIAMFDGRPMIYVEYTDIISDWPGTFEAVRATLGLEPMPAPLPFQKGTIGSVTELIANYDEVKAHYREHPVLSLHFEAAERGDRGIETRAAR